MLQGGGGFWVGGSSAGWVGLKLWTPTPLIIPRVSWVGLLPHTAGALFCFVVMQVAGVQVAVFQMGDLFFDNILNPLTFCCTKLSELVRSPVVKVHDCSSSDPWFKLWDCPVVGVSPFGVA